MTHTAREDAALQAEVFSQLTLKERASVERMAEANGLTVPALLRQMAKDWVALYLPALSENFSILEGT